MLEEEKTEIRKEGDPVFPDTEKENSADSSSDETNADTQSDEEKNSDEKKEGDAGFANHPRWKEREDDWKERFNKQEERYTNDLKAIREEFAEKIKPKRDDNSDIPLWFGGDENQWKVFQQDQERIIKEAEERAVERIESTASEERKRQEDANKYFEEQVFEIESGTGEKVDKNKLIKYAIDNDLVDSKGRWNWKVAHRLLTSTSEKPSNKEDRKKIADATSSDKKSDAKPPSFMTNEDFKKERPW